MKYLTLIFALTSFSVVADELFKVTCFMGENSVIKYKDVEVNKSGLSGVYKLVDSNGKIAFVPSSKCIVEEQD